MKQSLRGRLTEYLRKQYPNWVAKGDLDRLVMANTKFIPENCGRRLRESVSGKLSNGKTCPITLEVKYNEKNHALYRATQPKEVLRYENSEGKVLIVNKY